MSTLLDILRAHAADDSGSEEKLVIETAPSGKQYILTEQKTNNNIFKKAIKQLVKAESARKHS